MTEPVLNVITTLIAKPKCVGAVRASLKAMVAQSRLESGCIRYELMECLENPQQFVLNQVWRDRDAHCAHLQSEHILGAFDRFPELLASEFIIRRYREVEQSGWRIRHGPRIQPPKEEPVPSEIKSQQTSTRNKQRGAQSMYCLTVTYPISEDTNLDEDYYRNSHVPLCATLFADHRYLGCVLRTNQGQAPGKGGLNYASVDLLFDSAEQMQGALAAGGKEVSADIVD